MAGCVYKQVAVKVQYKHDSSGATYRWHMIVLQLLVILHHLHCVQQRLQGSASSHRHSYSRYSVHVITQNMA